MTPVCPDAFATWKIGWTRSNGAAKPGAMMGAFLFLRYAALCVVVFKLLRVPVNRWTSTTAVVAGGALVGGLLLGMNYNHPFTTDGRLYFFTTPIVPTVVGRVTDVPVEPNVPLKAGDKLFQIGPRSYQFVVDQKKACLPKLNRPSSSSRPPTIKRWRLRKAPKLN